VTLYFLTEKGKERKKPSITCGRWGGILLGKEKGRGKHSFSSWKEKEKKEWLFHSKKRGKTVSPHRGRKEEKGVPLLRFYCREKGKGGGGRVYCACDREKRGGRKYSLI